MRKTLKEISSGWLLYQTRNLSYFIWALGFFLGVATAVPRIMELKGRPMESSTLLAVIGGILIAIFAVIVIYSRMVNEIERRLSLADEKEASQNQSDA